MRKIFYHVCFLLVLAMLVFPNEDKESKRRWSLGISTGGFPFYSGRNSFIISGEINVRLSGRIGLKADVARTQHSYSFETKLDGDIVQSGQSSYSTFPMSLSFLLKSDANDNVGVDIGMGIGYYPIKIKEEYTRHTSSSGSSEVTDSLLAHKIAPHFLVGFETLVSPRIAFFGEIKHVLGKARLEKTKEDYLIQNYFFFGGTYILIGIRFFPC